MKQHCCTLQCCHGPPHHSLAVGNAIIFNGLVAGLCDLFRLLLLWEPILPHFVPGAHRALMVPLSLGAHRAAAAHLPLVAPLTLGAHLAATAHLVPRCRLLLNMLD